MSRVARLLGVERILKRGASHWPFLNSQSAPNLRLLQALKVLVLRSTHAFSNGAALHPRASHISGKSREMSAVSRAQVLHSTHEFARSAAHVYGATSTAARIAGAKSDAGEEARRTAEEEPTGR